jgi:hypothetical protein
MIMDCDDPHRDPIHTIRRNANGDLIIKWGGNQGAKYQWARYNFAGFSGPPNPAPMSVDQYGVCWPVAEDQWAVVYRPPVTGVLE